MNSVDMAISNTHANTHHLYDGFFVPATKATSNDTAMCMLGNIFEGRSIEYCQASSLFKIPPCSIGGRGRVSGMIKNIIPQNVITTAKRYANLKSSRVSFTTTIRKSGTKYTDI